MRGSAERSGVVGSRASCSVTVFGGIRAWPSRRHACCCPGNPLLLLARVFIAGECSLLHS